MLDKMENGTYNWSKEEFEKWLSTKDWDESKKNMHRKEFEDGNNTITFNDGQLWYGENS